MNTRLSTPKNSENHTLRLPSGRSDAFWPSVAAAMVIVAATAVGIVFHLGMMWHLICDGVTASALLGVVWELQRQRQRTAVKIEELLTILRGAKANAFGTELQTIEAELQRLQSNLLGRATFPR